MIKTIGVIGAGQMGNGIAHVASLAGYRISPMNLVASAAQVRAEAAAR